MSIDINEVFIPTYIIHSKEREEELICIKNQFLDKKEFEVNLIKGGVERISVMNLWNSIVKIVKTAVDAEDDVIIICDDSHKFTQNYNREYFINNVIEAFLQGADILSGGVTGFGYAVPVATNRYWVDYLKGAQFIVIYRKIFLKILEVQFTEIDTIDGILSAISDSKMVIHPFISALKYSSHPDGSNEAHIQKELVGEDFLSSDDRLYNIHSISNRFNYNINTSAEANTTDVRSVSSDAPIENTPTHHGLTFIISTMRSGSTLLKALLATRDEISDIQEVHLSRWMEIKSDKIIKVVKSPAYYNEYFYPIMPDVDSKKIILIRNPYDTITSLKEMNNLVDGGKLNILNEYTLLGYWIRIYENIMAKIDLNASDVFVIRYEDLVSDPINRTAAIFSFLGCSDCTGVNTYSRPVDYTWEWGKDDGGEVIKQLKVQDLVRKRDDIALRELISNSDKVRRIMTHFGYESMLC
ncbi:sulfotransferase [Chitinophaga sp. Hz27]|uniref:sulfotransferase family protein n=1 Tax=Chitinophaga sp. Hz27 TaxID=3347169 RepID=UPI0035D73251